MIIYNNKNTFYESPQKCLPQMWRPDFAEEKVKEILIILLFSRSCLILQLLGRSPVSLPTRQSGQGAALSLKIYLFIFSNSWCACGGGPSCPCFIALLPRSLETASLTELELCLWSASLRYPPVFIPHNAGITGTYNHPVLFTRMLRI